MGKSVIRTICAAALMLTVHSAAQAQAPWWDATYKARRQVTVYVPEWNLPGDDAAIMTFYTGGRLKPDGSDIRVVARAKEVPYRLYGVGPGDTATLAFRVERGVREYHVYFGDPAAAAPEYDWQPQRGLILETKGYKGGAPKNLAQMREIWRAAGPFYGADDVDRVWQGQNMFGPSDSFVSLYSGWIMCPLSGHYVFATSSDDSSFLMVDGRQVVAWPGSHGPVADARHNGGIELKSGLHRLEYMHVNVAGTTCAVAAWRLPGSKGFEIIPANAFAPLSRALVGPLELAGKRNAADFSFEITGEALLTGTEDLYAVKIAFANTSARITSNLVFWDFGDGQTGQGPGTTHVYLASGVYAVTMRVGRPGDAATVTNRINVHQHWGWQTRKEIDEIKAYFPEISRYNLETLDLASAANLLKLGQEQGSVDFVKRVALAIVARAGAARDTLEFATRQLRQALGPGRFAAAVQVRSAYMEAFAAGRGDSKALLALALADMFLEHGQAEEAGDVLKAALTEPIANAAKRRLFVAYADAARYAGDADGAADALAAAVEIPLGHSDVRNAALGGALAFKAEDCIARKEYAIAEEALDSWDLAKPLEKLQGYSAYLRARLYEGQGREARALRELGAVSTVSPDSAYAPKALLLAGKIQNSRGDRDAAGDAFDTILRSYQTSPEAEEARRMLLGLKR